MSEMHPAVKKALEEVTIPCKGGYLMDRVIKAIRRSMPQEQRLSYRRVKKELCAHCETRRSPGGPVLIDRYLKLLTNQPQT